MQHVLKLTALKCSLLVAFVVSFTFVPAQINKLAAQDSGQKTIQKNINLIDKQGKKLTIGQIVFTPSNKGETFTITFDDSKFSEHFLSMRPFKCIDGPQTVCHLIYPYKTKKRITKTDLQDLEYALLFIHKSQQEYGINFWNGIYYRLKRGADGNFTGTVWETDMNELASPPEQEYGRPIGGQDLVEAASGKHRFPKIEIK